MESNDLSSSPIEDPQLEGLLRQPAPPLPDNGFSNRVLAALPARAPVRRIRPQLAWCTAGALIGLVMAVCNGMAWSGGRTNLDDLSRTAELLLTIFADPVVLPALLVAGGSAFLVLGRGSPLNARIE